MRVQELNTSPCPEDQARILVSGHDGSVVTVGVMDSDEDYAEVNISAKQARELAVRLMQAADLADPEQAERYRGRDWF